MFQHPNNTGKIVLVEDYFVYVKLIKKQFSELGLANRLIVFSDG